jgi:microtubule-associated protein-like 6
VGLDDDHSLALYQWLQKRLIATGPSSKDKVLGLSFLSSPLAPTPAGAGGGGAGSCIDLVTCGVNHVKFWNPSGRNLSCQKGVFNGKPKATMLCVQDLGQQQLVVTGAATGALYVWRGHRSVSQSVSQSVRRW